MQSGGLSKSCVRLISVGRCDERHRKAVSRPLLRRSAGWALVGFWYGTVQTIVNALFHNVKVMTNHDAPKTLGELIAHVEQLREELLTIQRDLEKLEHAERGSSN